MYAHFDKSANMGQPLIEHLENVGKQMISDTEALNFSRTDIEALKNNLYLTGLYHDIGKAMPAFQLYLKTGEGGSEKNHSLISAAVFSTMFEKNDIFAYLSFLAIAKHHGDMYSTVSQEGQGFYRLANQYEDCFVGIEEHNFHIKNLKKYNFDLDNLKDFMKTKLYITNKRMLSDEYFFILQYIFSKLIWADKIDSADLYSYGHNAEKNLADIDKYIAKKNKGKIKRIDEKRSKIKNSVLSKIKNMSDNEIKDKKIFTLTAPTGTGKTMTSISAALLLVKRIQKLFGYTPRIITALPFINILEQTKKDYENIFGDILVHYGAIDYGESDNSNIPLKDRLFLTNAWEDNVIVTTFVQIFESLLSNKNSKILKVNKLSGSVVILDEIQSLPGKYYPLIGAVIKRLSDYYGTRFILMTATQPEIVAYSNMLLENDKMYAVELLENSDEYYKDLKRTKIVPVMDKIRNNEELVDFIFNTKKTKQTALVVVNTISQSIELYDKLCEKYKDKCKILYLSTNLTSVDRKNVIDYAHKLLDDSEEKEPLILVSTQTIEAGVDLNFDIGYRDLAPLESIVQVAGRINRAGDKDDFSPLYVFETDSGKLIYKNYNLNKTREVLKDEIMENEYSNIIKKYYKTLLSEDKSYDTEIYEAIKHLDYEKISTFSLIDKKDACKVIIENDNEIRQVINEYCHLISAGKRDYDTKAELKQLINKIERYTVEIRVKRLIKHIPWRFKDIYDIDLDIYIVPKENVKEYYNETGFISDNKDVLMY